MEILEQIPNEIIELGLVIVFSLSLGLQQRSSKESGKTFGTDRTFTLVGILGYMLLLANGESMIPYFIGFVIVGAFLSIYYHTKIMREGRYGATSMILVLLTYSFPMAVHYASDWMALLFFVLILVLADIKQSFIKLSNKFNSDEFLTLAKFVVISGLILPLLPKEPIASFIPASPYDVWLAVVVVSGISYVSYLLRKFAFPNKGLLITGILGGLYSSTATTFILARKSKDADAKPKAFAGCMVIATSMMFLRIYILAIIFNQELAITILPYFAVVFLASLAIGYWIYQKQETKNGNELHILEDENPLEMNVALIFAALYILFSFLTQYFLTQFGSSGLDVLSVVVGVTNVTPFLLNIFQGQYSVELVALAAATLQTMGSNTLIKGIYGYVLSSKDCRKWILIGFTSVLAVTITAIILFYIIH